MPSSLISFDGILWLLLTLGPLIFLQRALHRAIQTVFLLITRRADITVALFSLLFFPGVLLHEGSHFLGTIPLRGEIELIGFIRKLRDPR